jgi:hypothetical protein
MFIHTHRSLFQALNLSLAKRFSKLKKFDYLDPLNFQSLLTED